MKIKWRINKKIMFDWDSMKNITDKKIVDFFIIHNQSVLIKIKDYKNEKIK